MALEIEEIENIIELVCKHKLGSLEFENKNYKLHIKSPQAVTTYATPVPSSMIEAPIAPKTTATQSTTQDSSALHIIKSPIVGTFYSASEPGAAPFVQSGSTIHTDMVIGIIEAMKVMNEIQSEVSGTVHEVLVHNGAAVEYGQPLMSIKKSN